jgi:hypothetical protein
MTKGASLRPTSNATSSAPKSRLSTPITSESINFQPTAAEPEFLSRSHASSETIQIAEMIQVLSNENKSLRRKLFLNGINLPEDSRKAMSYGPNRFLISQGSQEATLFSSLSGTSSPIRSRSARTIASSNNNSRPGTTPRAKVFHKLDLPEISTVPDYKRATSGKTVMFAEDKGFAQDEDARPRPRTVS